MYQLEYLEIQIIDYCNLNCRGCSHFANLDIRKTCYDLLEFEKDLLRMREFFENIRTIRILGGEPLLCKNIHDYAMKCRYIFPHSSIHIVTNGILVQYLNHTVLEAFKNNSIIIDISNYPPTNLLKDKIERILKDHEIIYTFTELIKSFRKSINLNGDEDPAESYNRCIGRKCTFLYKGRLALCSAPLLINKFYNYFQIEFDVSFIEDTLNIYDDLTAQSINDYLNKPMDCCRYCGKSISVPWSNKGIISINDWIL